MIYEICHLIYKKKLQWGFLIRKDTSNFSFSLPKEKIIIKEFSFFLTLCYIIRNFYCCFLSKIYFVYYTEIFNSYMGIENVRFIRRFLFFAPILAWQQLYVKRTSPLNNSHAILLVSNVKAEFYDIILMAGLFRLMKNRSCHLTSCCNFCGVFLFFPYFYFQPIR